MVLGFCLLTGGLGSRAHVPAQMRHPGRADAARTSVGNGHVSVAGRLEAGRPRLGPARCTSRAPGDSLPPAALGSHPGRSDPASCAGRGGPSAGRGERARSGAHFTNQAVALGPDREQDRETDFAL